jgi:AcrR family transcriptional regulator
VPRAGLSEERVIDEAVRLADEVGLEQMTLTMLAERLGVRQPSLYKHVDGIASLRHSISLRAKVTLAEVLARSAVGRSCDDAIISMSRAYRGWALEHPGQYEAAQRAPDGTDPQDLAVSRAVVEICADVLLGYGLVDHDAIDAIRAFRAALHGFLTLEASGAFGLPRDIDRSYDQLVRALSKMFANWPVSTPTESDEP